MLTSSAAVAPPPLALNPLLTPLIGIVGVLLGVIGNSLFTERREKRSFNREKKLEVYLEIIQRIELIVASSKESMKTRLAATEKALDGWDVLYVRSSIFGSEAAAYGMSSFKSVVMDWEGNERVRSDAPQDYKDLTPELWRAAYRLRIDLVLELEPRATVRDRFATYRFRARTWVKRRQIAWKTRTK